MKVVYIAGPFRGPTAWAIAENVRAAERAALSVAELDAVPLCPHANTAHFHGLLTERFWVEGTLELMRRCDAVYVFDGQRSLASAGTQGEVLEARRLDMPVFYGLDGLREWLERAS